jgi:hypothetical protein
LVSYYNLYLLVNGISNAMMALHVLNIDMSTLLSESEIERLFKIINQLEEKFEAAKSSDDEVGVLYE